jgi:galactokinase
MLETHNGLSNLYEVSCEELDYLVQLTYPHQEVVGARMMGGGFGGCTINIVKRDAVDRIIESIQSTYYVKFNIEIDAYVVQIKSGTSLTNR